MESRKQSAPDKRARAWQGMLQVFRKHFLIKSRLEYFGRLDWEWLDYSAAERFELVAVIRENPRFGPVFGLEPVAGQYQTGEGIEAAYSRANLTPPQVRKERKIINFADYRKCKQPTSKSGKP